MASISNNLSWSISRSELFNFCKRKYYFNYYESWEGWNNRAPLRKQKAYFLKNRQQADPWVGDIVHKAIKYTIQNPDKATHSFVIDSLVKRLKYDYEQSLRQNSRTAKPKDFWFFEHYQGRLVDLTKYTEKALLCIENFFNSFILDEIRWAAENQQIIYLDEGDINKMLFQLGHIPVYAIPDLCFRREDGSVLIVDWKTGKSKEEELSAQLKLYATRLSTIDEIDPQADQVEGYAFYLAEDELKGRQVLDEDIEEMKRFANTSFQSMQDVLSDVSSNTPLPEEAFEKTSSENKCSLCVFKEICQL